MKVHAKTRNDRIYKKNMEATTSKSDGVLVGIIMISLLLIFIIGLIISFNWKDGPCNFISIFCIIVIFLFFVYNLFFPKQKEPFKIISKTRMTHTYPRTRTWGDNNKDIINLETYGYPKPISQRRIISSSVRKYVYARDNGRCVDCGSNIDIEYDHIIPVSKGGSSSENNIQLLCRACNRRKHAKIQ